jgi:hypothetical protein
MSAVQPQKSLLELHNAIQKVIVEDSHGDYTALLATLSSKSLCKISASDYDTYVKGPFERLEGQIILALNSSGISISDFVAINSSSALGDVNPYVRVLATIPDGWALYDTKNKANCDLDHSPFSTSNNSCTIASMKDANGVVVPDSHMTRIAFQQAAGQLSHGFTFESKQTKGNKLGLEQRFCTKMVKSDNWFNCGFFSVAVYNIDF